MAMPRARPPSPRLPPAPLDAAQLDALALAYVGRFATSAVRLERYLARKLRERGWAGDSPAPAALAAAVDRCVRLGFVDDAEFARMRGNAMARRGVGSRRLRGQLMADGIGDGDAAPVLADAADARVATALVFARRRRLGPFGRMPLVDRQARDKAFAAFLRAGHDAETTRLILSIAPGDAAALDELDAGSEER